MTWRASGVQSRLVAISTSAAVSDRASLPNTPRTFWMTDRSATIAATPTAMQMKKNSSRFHDDRVSRTAMRRTKTSWRQHHATVAQHDRASARRGELGIVRHEHQRRPAVTDARHAAGP